MKIAIVGKGGAGKSSISRLITQYLLHQNKQVCAIDSDHNMDFMDTLGYTFTDESPTFIRLYDELFEYLGAIRGKDKPNDIISNNLGSHKFSLEKADSFTQKVMIPLSPNCKLAVVGLGQSDILTGTHCAHGLSNPLKIYLSLLNEGTYSVIVDGVAGLDMVNFGLYHTCDYLIIVVEPTKNGVKVAKQIKHVCDVSNANYGLLINKYQANHFTHQLYEEMGDKIIGSIAYDEGLFTYEYHKIAETLHSTIHHLYQGIQAYKGFSLDERMRKLYEIKGL